MATAVGAIDTLIGDTRFWINDRNINPTYDNNRLLRRIAHSHDRIIEDVFTAPIDKPFMQFDLPLVPGKREYLLPTGIGHVYEMGVLDSFPGSSGTTEVDRLVGAIIPTYKQDDVRWPGWIFNPPFLKLERGPTKEITVRITFLPRAIDYIHQGLVADTGIQDVTYANKYQIVVTPGATGNFKVQWKGEVSGNISVSASVGDVETALEAFTGIIDVTVTGVAGNWTVTFVNPVGIQPPIEVHTQPTTGSVSVLQVATDDYPFPLETTFQLAASPSIGVFDPRPNAFLGGRLRILEAGIPLNYSSFSWQERDIIEYDPQTRKVSLSSKFDFTVWATGTTIKYEILPFSETTLLNACAVETARHVLYMAGNLLRARIVKEEYDIAISTARRVLASRNRAIPMMPTPRRYLRREARQLQDAVIRNVTSNTLDRYQIVP